MPFRTLPNSGRGITKYAFWNSYKRGIRYPLVSGCHSEFPSRWGLFGSLNILTGYVTSNPITKDQDMTKQTKLIDHFAKVNDNYTITNCHNGYVVDVAGQDGDDNWINAKFVFKTLDELKDVVQDLVWMPRT